MIDIKTISKPKSQGSSTTYVGGQAVMTGVAEEALHAARADRAVRAEQAAEANHAKNADYAQRAAYADKAGAIAEDAVGLENFLRKDKADTAHGLITLERGAEFGVYAPGWQGTGAKVEADGAAEVDSLKVRKQSLFGGLLGSAEFTSGFPGGKGWQLYPYTKTNAAGQEETKWGLEIDGVTVRGTFRVYEMIVNQLRGENDNYIFAGMMKVDHYDPTSGRIYLDTEKGVLYNPFREGDILMVQRFGGADNMSVKQYELRVTAAGTGDLSDGEDRLDWLEFTNLTASVDDIAGRDILVRVDSVTDPTRKGIVTVTTINDTGAPYIDVLYGLKTDPDDATRCRMGNLSGIRTKSGVDLTNVWGLYARGAYFEQSTIVLDNGNTVEQQFQVMDGKLLSEIAEVRAAVQQEGEVLSNPSFARDTIHWTADTGTMFYEQADSPMWDGSEFMAERRGGSVSIAEDGGRNSLLVTASSIKQAVAEMTLPTHAAADPGDPEAGIPADPGDQPPYTYSFSLYIRVVEAGTLTAGIQGSGLWLEKAMQPTDGYEKVAMVGTWDETGAFLIAFTGKAYVRDASLRNDALAGATERLKTVISQTAEEIKLWAGKEIETATGAITDKYDAELKVMADQIGACVTHEEFNEKTGELETKWEGKLTVTSERIDGLVTKVDNINGTIEKAGWITKADAQTLFASKTLEDGSTIVSYINQTASSIKISAEHLELDGVVSFSMFDYDTQRIINDIGDAADNAQNTANDARNTANSASSAASSAQSTANSAASAAAQAKQDAAEALSDAADAYRQAQTANNNAQTAISNASTANSNANSAVNRAAEAIQSAADALNAATAAQTSVDNLPGWSKEASIVKALQDQTVIAGGFISASMIDVENLIVTKLAATEGTIGGFDITDRQIGGNYGSESIGGETRTAGMTLTKSQILFEDVTDETRSVSVGTMYPSMTTPRLATFTDLRTFSSSLNIMPNVGIMFDIRNNSYANIAFMGNGAGFLNGPVCGYMPNVVVPVATQSGAPVIDIALGNYVLINKRTTSTCYVKLPSKGILQSKMSGGSSAPFAVEMTITVPVTTGGNVRVLGGDGSLEPQLYNADMGEVDYWEISKGDTMKLCLMYHSSVNSGKYMGYVMVRST